MSSSAPPIDHASGHRDHLRTSLGIACYLALIAGSIGVFLLIRTYCDGLDAPAAV